ncbi:unnamed protein product [Musa textilis]
MSLGFESGSGTPDCVFAFIAKDSGVDDERAFAFSLGKSRFYISGADYTIAMVISNLKGMSTRMILFQLYLQVNNKVMVI